MNPNKQKQNNLVLYRRRMGFTQKRVAHLLGHRHTSMVSRYERGRSDPPLPVALGLEIILRTPVAFLFPDLHNEIRQRVRQAEEAELAKQQTINFPLNDLHSR
jgi:DNA-binding XRE family transcriptional regulator